MGELHSAVDAAHQLQLRGQLPELLQARVQADALQDAGHLSELRWALQAPELQDAPPQRGLVKRDLMAHHIHNIQEIQVVVPHDAVLALMNDIQQLVKVFTGHLPAQVHEDCADLMRRDEPGEAGIKLGKDPGHLLDERVPSIGAFLIRGAQCSVLQTGVRCQRFRVPSLPDHAQRVAVAVLRHLCDGRPHLLQHVRQAALEGGRLQCVAGAHGTETGSP
mmetsp:Transcript_118985/g.331961  ORF Transcript_118985/g.331961 Transcript_118985/m.331961 type:complete len:220 (+) Transcript_118985:711-1370(+)